jgi:lipoate-protein ligase A
VRTAGPWAITDSGVGSAPHHMAVDQAALDAMLNGTSGVPTVRFFQWDKPVVTYGYLLDSARVKAWADANGGLDIVQRPTGGGAVIHHPADLAISFLWPRKSGLLPGNPRDCYAEIHAMLGAGLKRFLADAALSLYSRPDQSCETEATDGQNRFSVCFEAPVCNDVMLGDRKIIGGALRITRQAILYQGAVQLGRAVDTEALKRFLLASIEERLRGRK